MKKIINHKFKISFLNKHAINFSCIFFLEVIITVNLHMVTDMCNDNMEIDVQANVTFKLH